MSSTHTIAPNEEIAALEQELMELKDRLREARRRAPSQKVKSYTFKTLSGREVTLAELFGSKRDLILIHNMGRQCVYCTLWADGLTGFTQHLKDRAAFVLVTPDDPATAAAFARERGWNFPIVSAQGTTFKKDMGFEPEPGQTWPGAQTFRKDDDGTIRAVGRASFGPGDDFCALWPLFDLLEGGPGDWQPKYTYKPAAGSCGPGCGCH